MNWTHVLIHHSASSDTDGQDSETFRRNHLAKGWRDIGYHAVAEKVHGRYVVISGRSTGWEGSHCPGMNKLALGLCLAGNYSVTKPPKELLEVAAAFVAGWCDAWRIPTDNVHGHRDHRATECPGNLFDMQAFRKMVDTERGAHR